MEDLRDRAVALGARVSGEQVTQDYHHERWENQKKAEAQGKPTKVYWDFPGLRITRLRMVSDPGFPWWDVTYCHGELLDGTKVDVSLPFFQLPKRGMLKAIVDYAKKDKVFAKRTGILDNISTLS